MEITVFELLKMPFVDPGFPARRVWKIVQIWPKTRANPTQKDHGKTSPPVSQWKKILPIAWRAKMHQNAFIFAVRGVALLGESVPKSRQTRPNSTQNEHEKTCIPISQAQKIHPNASNSSSKYNVNAKEFSTVFEHLDRWTRPHRSNRHRKKRFWAKEKSTARRLKFVRAPKIKIRPLH